MSKGLMAFPNPVDANRLPGFRMFAVVGTWMEADIIAATIRNAITQGCERVYLVDNDSQDDTVTIARQEGGVIARTYKTERYDENERLRHMNDVVSEISHSEGAQHIWWLFLDADEFHHGPRGMTLREYLKTLDRRFRVVGTRFFDHYPSAIPHYVTGHHPLDFQPLCHEVSYPMCRSGHRKHPLQRYDRDLARIECGGGFHHAHCAEQLYEPALPAFLHHFPFREEDLTRRRLEALWRKDRDGVGRAQETRETTHMLARFRSLDAVYSRGWKRVQNFVALEHNTEGRRIFSRAIARCSAILGRWSDTMHAKALSAMVPLHGVDLKPWEKQVEAEHVPFLRWYPTMGAWKYKDVKKHRYGGDISYKKGITFLDGNGTIEDWGCGFAHAKLFVRNSRYIGLDGSSPHADRIVNLSDYKSDIDCIFMRHVLEHNVQWRRILANAIASFRKRMVVVIFTPFSETTRVIANSSSTTSVIVPDISFKKEDLTDSFENLRYTEESLHTESQYGTEHVFYIKK
jgi:hypothetical protein